MLNTTACHKEMQLKRKKDEKEERKKEKKVQQLLPEDMSRPQEAVEKEKASPCTQTLNHSCKETELNPQRQLEAK
jgi:hypothetical protein